MGSTSSSHLDSSSSSTKSSASGGSRLSRTKRKLSNLFCGALSSKSTIHELEDCPEISSIRTEISSIRCSESLAPIRTPQDPIVEFSSVFTSEAGDTISIQESGDSSEGSSESEDAFLESMPLNVQGCRDPLPSQPAQELVCNNATECISEVIDDHDATSEGTDIICPGHDLSTNLEEGLTISQLQSNDLEHSHSAVVSYNNSDLRSLSIVSDSLPRIRFPGDDIAHVTTTSSPGFLVSESDQDLRSGDLLRLDLVSISSNTLSGNITEANSDESRRNSLRLFWDALSRRSLRRHSDAPTFVIASSFSDDWGSHNRWLLDFSGDLRYYGTGRDFDSFRSRLHRGNERRWLLRSEVSETTDFFNEGDQETTFCASGLHVDGTCSCDSFFTAEESSSIASISRIIMLAEALFEVLDEIHLQSLSLSLSTLSLPAPESVVDAFPLKYHKKIKNAESDSSDVRQCHICLCEYEDGDELRVLPCNHEYHVPCVDKWLKEVNRVCPLCRHDVCEGHRECSIPNLHESSS